MNSLPMPLPASEGGKRMRPVLPTVPANAAMPVMAVLAVAAMLLPNFPLVTHLTSLQGNWIYLACCMLILLCRFGHIRMTSVELCHVAAVMLAMLSMALYWNEPRLLIFPLYYVLALFTVAALPQATRRLVVQMMSILLLLLCIGAVLGFMYALAGMPPILTIDNPDQREAGLYLTTMTNVAWGNMIRPSGLFDEPGAFSFYICLTAAARHMMGMPKRLTWLLLLGGFVSLSLAHLVYVLIHFAVERHLSFKGIMNLGIMGLLLCIPLLNNDVMQVVDEFFLQRLEMSQGVLAGDNRSDSFLNALAYLDPATILAGIDPVCVPDWKTCQDRYLPFGENVLTPAVQAGVIAAFPYYYVLIGFILYGLRRRQGLVCLGVAALLMQRPFVTVCGYALLILLVFKLAQAMPSRQVRMSGSLAPYDAYYPLHQTALQQTAASR